MKLIGLAGFKGAGKNETANCISDFYTAGPVQQIAYADKVKIGAMKALGFERPDDELIALANSMKDAAAFTVMYQEPGVPFEPYEFTSVLHGFTGREYIQWFGTEFGRKVLGEYIWVNQLLPTCKKKLNFMYPDAHVLVVTDVRFENEAGRIRDLGGEVWRVERKGLIPDGHDSENVLPDELIDARVVNNGTPQDLYDTVAWLCEDRLA